jgi:hypothetical protein
MLHRVYCVSTKWRTRRLDAVKIPGCLPVICHGSESTAKTTLVGHDTKAVERQPCFGQGHFARIEFAEGFT